MPYGGKRRYDGPDLCENAQSTCTGYGLWCFRNFEPACIRALAAPPAAGQVSSTMLSTWGCSGQNRVITRKTERHSLARVVWAFLGSFRAALSK